MRRRFPSQSRKAVLLEDLTRRRALHEIKANETSARVAKMREEARGLMRAGKKEDAKRRLLESKKTEGLLARTRHVVDLCDSAVVTLEEDTTTFATISVLTEVQRYHRPNAQVVTELDTALDNLRDMQMSADEVQGAISSGLGGSGPDDDELEEELNSLMREDAGLPPELAAPVADPAFGMPAVPRSTAFAQHAEPSFKDRAASTGLSV